MVFVKFSADLARGAKEEEEGGAHGAGGKPRQAPPPRPAGLCRPLPSECLLGAAVRPGCLPRIAPHFRSNPPSLGTPLGVSALGFAASPGVTLPSMIIYFNRPPCTKKNMK